MKILRQLGSLRVGLGVLALAVVLLRPAAGGAPVYEGWAVVPTLLVPTLAPLIFLGLVLDMLMTRVLMTDTQGGERGRYRTVLWTDFVLVALLALAWVPFFMTLGN